MTVLKLNVAAVLGLMIHVIPGTNPVNAQVDAANVDALAKALANPGGALSSMTNKIEIRWYDGDLPDADKQHSYTYVFQPVLPFPVADGDTFIIRPAFSYLKHQPHFDASALGFDQTSAFGDIAFDLLYSFGNIEPYVLGLGLVGALPTGTDDRITGENWLLGPELLFAKQFDWGIAGFLAFHQWKAAGQGAEFNVSSFQPLFAYSLGDGVTIGPSGTFTYNWNAEHDNAWTVPVGLNIGKATTLNGKPIKYATASLIKSEWVTQTTSSFSECRNANTSISWQMRCWASANDSPPGKRTREGEVCTALHNFRRRSSLSVLFCHSPTSTSRNPVRGKTSKSSACAIGSAVSIVRSSGLL
jgi:hypothetical protein